MRPHRHYTIALETQSAMLMPLLLFMCIPVINLAFSETKNETREATSSGRPTFFRVDAFLNFSHGVVVSKL